MLGEPTMLSEGKLRCTLSREGRTCFRSQQGIRIELLRLLQKGREGNFLRIHLTDPSDPAQNRYRPDTAIDVTP